MSSEDMDKKPTSIQLKMWRKRMGWTQPQAAEALFCCTRSYKGWEYGDPCKQSIIALALLIEEKQGKK